MLVWAVSAHSAIDLSVVARKSVAAAATRVRATATDAVTQWPTRSRMELAGAAEVVATGRARFVAEL